jgi:hypothetical protein
VDASAQAITLSNAFAFARWASSLVSPGYDRHLFGDITDTFPTIRHCRPEKPHHDQPRKILIIHGFLLIT